MRDVQITCPMCGLPATLTVVYSAGSSKPQTWTGIDERHAKCMNVVGSPQQLDQVVASLG